jgi:hypothetical protein
LESVLPQTNDRIDWSQPYVIPVLDSFEFAVHYYTPKHALDQLRAAAGTPEADAQADGTVVQLPCEATTEMGKRWRADHSNLFPRVKELAYQAVKMGAKEGEDSAVLHNVDSLMILHALLRMWYPEVPVFVTPAFADTGMGFTDSLYFLRTHAPIPWETARKLVNPEPEQGESPY